MTVPSLSVGILALIAVVVLIVVVAVGLILIFCKWTKEIL